MSCGWIPLPAQQLDSFMTWRPPKDNAKQRIVAPGDPPSAAQQYLQPPAWTPSRTLPSPLTGPFRGREHPPPALHPHAHTPSLFPPHDPFILGPIRLPSSQVSRTSPGASILFGRAGYNVTLRQRYPGRQCGGIPKGYGPGRGWDGGIQQGSKPQKRGPPSTPPPTKKSGQTHDAQPRQCEESSLRLKLAPGGKRPPGKRKDRPIERGASSRTPAATARSAQHRSGRPTTPSPQEAHGLTAPHLLGGVLPPVDQ